MNEFQKARLKLTAWYILICFILLAISNIAALNAEKTAFNRILQVVSNKKTRPHVTELFQTYITDFEKNFRIRLFYFDGILLVFATWSAYFLSGVTLKPIQKMVKLQDEFAADASHELRTPLTTMSMEIVALKRTEKKIPDKYLRVLTSIEEEIGRMRNIVDGLLTLVRYSNNSFRQNWKRFDLTDLAKEAFEQMKPFAANKKIAYSFSAPTDFSVNAIGSRDQIKQVLLILLDNAIKYTPQKGTIHLLVKKQNHTVFAEVKDSGFGIPQEDQHKIFERFYRGRYASKYYEKGSGIGLAIAKRIINNYNGSIGVKSEAGKGSEFFFELPAAA